jgi:two-component system, NarL family, sensor histidine kinase DesK
VRRWFGHDGRMRQRLRRIRAAQALPLLFLVGPASALATSSLAPVRIALIWLCLAAFVAVYLVSLPPSRMADRRGAAIRALAALAVLEAAVLALGAPNGFLALTFYVVAAAGLLLPMQQGAVAAAAGGGVLALGFRLTGSSATTGIATGFSCFCIGLMMVGFRRQIEVNQELREARHELASHAVTEERLRIARDLHDLLGHSLSIVALKAQLADRLLDRDPEGARAEIKDIHEVSRQSLTEVREAVHGYRKLAFEEALDGARAALTAAGIRFRVDGSADDLPDEVETVLAWALREATTNIVRHSGARECEITVAADGEQVALQVDDDGSADEATTGGAGLVGLAERAQRLHGTLEAGARPGGGFRLRLQVPLGAT